MFSQFLSALNLFPGGKEEISRNALTKVYQNLLFQALSKKETRIKFKFDAFENLTREINFQQMLPSITKIWK